MRHRALFVLAALLLGAVAAPGQEHEDQDSGENASVEPDTTENPEEPTTIGPCPTGIADVDYYQCETLRRLGFCETNYERMFNACAPTCGFCGTKPQPPTPTPDARTTLYPPTTTKNPHCNTISCSVFPGKYNENTCPDECAEFTCKNRSISLTEHQCLEQTVAGWCHANLWVYCPFTCNRCLTSLPVEMP